MAWDARSNLPAACTDVIMSIMLSARLCLAESARKSMWLYRRQTQAGYVPCEC